MCAKFMLVWLLNSKVHVWGCDVHYCIGSVCGLCECALIMCAYSLRYLAFCCQPSRTVCGFVSLHKQSFSLLPFLFLISRKFCIYHYLRWQGQFK